MQGKYIFYTLLAVLLGSGIFTSCEKAQSVEPQSDNYTLPGEQCNMQVMITGDSLYRAGNSLKLQADVIYATGPAEYTWYWPSGDSSKGQRLEIQGLSPEQSGTYIVQAAGPKQCYAQAFIDVRVLPAIPTCEPLENSMEIMNELDVAFNNTYKYIHNVNENLVLQANNADYTLEIEFRGDSAIAGKQYFISGATTFEQLQFNQVLARLTYQNGTPFRSITQGKAFVEYVDGRLSVTLCNGRLTDNSTSKTIDANITSD